MRHQMSSMLVLPVIQSKRMSTTICKREHQKSSIIHPLCPPWVPAFFFPSQCPLPQFSFSYNHFCSLLKTPSARVKVCLYLCKMHFQDYSMQPRYFLLIYNEMHYIHFPLDVYTYSVFSNPEQNQNNHFSSLTAIYLLLITVSFR